VRLDLPPHWRALYWALAVWSVGGCVALGADDAAPADLLVTADPPTAADPRTAAGPGGAAVLVTLPALARSAPGGAPAGVMDEARELATYGDQFDPWARPAPGDPALARGGERTPYDAVVAQRDWAGGTRLHTRSADLAEVLTDALAAWAVDGSVVLSRGPADPAVEDERLRAEGVTLPR
jgi:uncharacterized protein (TIGR03089 family)